MEILGYLGKMKKSEWAMKLIFVLNWFKVPTYFNNMAKYILKFKREYSIAGNRII